MRPAHELRQVSQLGAWLPRAHRARAAGPTSGDAAPSPAAILTAAESAPLVAAAAHAGRPQLAKAGFATAGVALAAGSSPNRLRGLNFLGVRPMHARPSPAAIGHSLRTCPTRPSHAPPRPLHGVPPQDQRGFLPAAKAAPWVCKARLRGLPLRRRPPALRSGKGRRRWARVSNLPTCLSGAQPKPHLSSRCPPTRAGPSRRRPALQL